MTIVQERPSKADDSRLFEDPHQSLDVLDKFKAKAPSFSSFRALVLSKAVWPNLEPTPGFPPASVQETQVAICPIIPVHRKRRP
jgi:hypothetical protein